MTARVQDRLAMQFTYSKPDNEEVIGICFNDGAWELIDEQEDFTTTLQRKMEEEPRNWLLGWVAGTSQDGYGRIYFDGKQCEAHRISYELFIGPVPEDMNVLHECDNPPCINPSHLFSGSTQDNVEDMDNKGRRRNDVGSANPRSKLSESDIPGVRKLLAAGNTQQSIADQLGVSQGAISLINSGKNWSHV